jgi:hypothetical protein
MNLTYLNSSLATVLYLCIPSSESHPYSAVLVVHLNNPFKSEAVNCFVTSLRFTVRGCQPHAQPKLEDHTLSFVRSYLFNIFAVSLHSWRPSLYPQPEDAPCCDDRWTHLIIIIIVVTTITIYSVAYVSSLLHLLPSLMQLSLHTLYILKVKATLYLSAILRQRFFR